MKYVSLDIETSGLNKGMNNILQIALVVDDLTSPIENLPTFVQNISHDYINFDNAALRMHMGSSFLNEYMEDRNKQNFDSTMYAIDEFLRRHYVLADNEKYNFAGKNILNFDIPFVKTTMDMQMFGDRPDWINKIHHRTIDPSVYFTNFIEDTEVPNLDKCLERAGIEKNKRHHALNDALDIVKLVRYISKK